MGDSQNFPVLDCVGVFELRHVEERGGAVADLQIAPTRANGRGNGVV
jgi:hypothetical protein